MRKQEVVLLLLGICSLGDAFSWHRNAKDWDIEMQGAFNMLRNMAAHNATFRTILEEHFKTFDQDIPDLKVPYSCDLPRSPSPPTSAHAVRPGDINVIASLGDSITAGFGITAETVIEVLRNDRQLSWITGGVQSLDRGVVTIANILRKFNAGISGFSYAESWPEDREAGLNVAIGGETADGMPEQTESLIQKMQDPTYGVDFDNDWKLISFLIGGNDLCRYCWDPDYFSAENFAAYIRQSLDILYARVPKAIVVLSNIFDITPLPAFSDSLVCDIIQSFVCSCAEEKEQMQQAQRQYVQRVRELVASGRYDFRGDFTVVYMTHMDKSLPPYLPGTDDVDKSFWAPDCFHPGRKGHFAVATSLWNQMFEPVGEGRREDMDWQIGTNLVCPSEDDPFIKTNINSRKTQKDEYKDEEIKE